MFLETYNRYRDVEDTNKVLLDGDIKASWKLFTFH